MESEIQKFYHGKKLLVTGASGFIGKVLLWKLLYSCPTIDTIYILMRSKKGQSVQKRVEDLVNVPIFDNFKQENPKLLDKIVAIAGDVGVAELGLSLEDRQKLINEVNVVFHIAAALNMDAPITKAVNLNTAGVLRLLQLCTEMKRLMSFVHTSTAYCYVDKEITEEAVYGANIDPYDVIRFSEIITKYFDEDLVKLLTTELIKPHPNTYTYTKRLAEVIVSDHFPKLPVSIARPSIVIPSLKEPIPGWVDSLNGPVAIMIASGKGVMRSMLCDGSKIANVVAVDTVVNNIIALGWSVAMKKMKLKSIPVINITAIESEPIYWNDVVKYGMEAVEKYPFESILWYPGIKINTNKFVHYMTIVLFQMIPAYILDMLLILIGKKRFLVRVQDKLFQAQLVLQYFTTRDWVFKNDNLLQLRQSLNSTDKEDFPLTMKDFSDRSTFISNALLIARKYILKNEPETIPHCKRKMKTYYAIDCVARFIGIFLLLWLAFRFFSYLAATIQLD